MRMVFSLDLKSESGIEIPATSTIKQTEILIANSAKLDETMAKKQNNFHSGVEQVVRFLKDDDWW